MSADLFPALCGGKDDEQVHRIIEAIWQIRSLEQIEQAVRMLPEGAIAKLARGPREEPECGICAALNMTEEFAREHPQIADAATFLLDYHELLNDQLLPISMAFSNAPQYLAPVVESFIGTLVFTRCQLVYATAEKVVLAGIRPA